MKILLSIIIIITSTNLGLCGRWFNPPQNYGQQFERKQEYQIFLSEVAQCIILPMTNQIPYAYDHFANSREIYRNTFFIYWCHTNQTEIIKWIDQQPYPTNDISSIFQYYISTPYRLLNNFTILDPTDDGCRIRCGNGDYFLKGFIGYSDRTYDNVLVIADVPFKYKTVTGATRLIPSYRVLNKEEKIECFRLAKENIRQEYYQKLKYKYHVE